MITAKKALKICNRRGKLSFDKKYPGVVKYVKDKIKNSAMAGYSRVVLECGELFLVGSGMKMSDLAEFLRNKGYLIKVVNDSREDDGLLIVLWYRF